MSPRHGPQAHSKSHNVTCFPNSLECFGKFSLQPETANIAEQLMIQSAGKVPSQAQSISMCI